MLDDSSGETELVAVVGSGNMHAACRKKGPKLGADTSEDHEAAAPTVRALQNGSAAQTTSGQQNAGSARPRRNAKRAAVADESDCLQANDFFMPTTKKKRKVLP